MKRKVDRGSQSRRPFAALWRHVLLCAAVVAIPLVSAEAAPLRVPPGNRLEKLSGRREGQWSIRINDQWRVCFEWVGTNAMNVEICDYH